MPGQEQGIFLSEPLDRCPVPVLASSLCKSGLKSDFGERKSYVGIYRGVDLYHLDFGDKDLSASEDGGGNRRRSRKDFKDGEQYAPDDIEPG